MNANLWNLMYIAGNTGRLIGDANNPQRRAVAIKGAGVVAGNGWRCWVEHATTKKRIFESPREIEHRGTSPAVAVSN